MSRVAKIFIACAALAAFSSSTATAYDGGLVRIEPRPYYGAVVSIEQGVRVFRPLPNQNLMIINPGNKTPINLTFSRTIEHKAADSSGSNGSGQSNAASSDAGARYGGISGFGNNVGTNPQYRNGARAAGYSGVRGHRPHVKKPVHH
jgi:hypothetical protein